MIHLFAFLKTAADTALWIAGASVVISLFYPVADLTPAVLLLGLGGGIAHFFSLKKHSLRFLGVIPGLLIFLLCKTPGDFLTLAPAAAYLVLSISRDLLQTDQTQMYYRFRELVLSCLAVSFLCFLRKLNWSFSLCMFSLTAWVFLMRMLRHDISDFSDRKLVALELGLMGAVCILILALSRDAVMAAGFWVIKKVYFTVIAPILMVIIWAMLLVVRFFDWFLGLFFTGKFEMDLSGMAMQSFEAVQDMVPAEPGADVGVKYVLLILKAIGIILFFTAAFLVFRRLLSGASKTASARESEDHRKALTDTELSTAEVSILDRSPAARVRRSYGSYCRTVEKCRRKLTPMDTTRDVNLLADMGGEAEELRRLYFRARYTDGLPLTPSDARKAAALSKTLKSKLQKNQEDKK